MVLKSNITVTNEVTEMEIKFLNFIIINLQTTDYQIDDYKMNVKYNLCIYSLINFYL